MKISIVIPTYNRLEMLKQTIDSILLQDSYNWELIIVDNNCTDGTEHYVKSIMTTNNKVRYLKETRQGVSYSRNAGAYIANHDIIAFIDDDEWADSQWVNQIIRVFMENTNVGCVGGRTILENKHEIPFWISPKLYSVLGDWSLADSTEEYCIVGRIGIGSGNMSIRRDVFRQIGGFDIKLGRKGDVLLADEDLRLTENIYDAGYEIAYNPKAIAYHFLIKSRLSARYFIRNAKGLAYSRAKKSKLFNYVFEVIYRLLRLPFSILKPSTTMYNIMRFYIAVYKLKAAIYQLMGNGINKHLNTNDKTVIKVK